MRLEIKPEVLEKYPQVEVGWLVAQVFPLPSDPVVERLKASLAGEISALGLTLENLSSHPDVAGWRQVFGSMGVKPSKYRSSLEALLRRVLKEKSLWTVNSVVDLYNCVSVKVLLPMGAFDLDKVIGDIEIRYGRSGEKFFPLGSKGQEEVLPGHVVYADSEKICTWLWNHRDSRLSGLDEGSRRAVFVVDHAFSTTTTTTTTETALEILWEKLAETGSRPSAKGICSFSRPCQEIA
jgi:DNA/RNA-binding domain of Phe-tRNA-synthetase-like protein